MDDWIRRPEKGIKYFSGTAVYLKFFDVSQGLLKESGNALFLDLGEVRSIARVIINNRDLGVVWTAPRSIKIPHGLLKSKHNKLVIQVTNVWANRLIGDEQEPADCEWLPGEFGGAYLKEFPKWFLTGAARPSNGRYCFTTWNYFTKDSPLVPSGLIGLVKMVVAY